MGDTHHEPALRSQYSRHAGQCRLGIWYVHQRPEAYNAVEWPVREFTQIVACCPEYTLRPGEIHSHKVERSQATSRIYPHPWPLLRAPSANGPLPPDRTPDHTPTHLRHFLSDQAETVRSGLGPISRTHAVIPIRDFVPGCGSHDRISLGLLTELD